MDFLLYSLKSLSNPESVLLKELFKKTNYLSNLSRRPSASVRATCCPWWRSIWPTSSSRAPRTRRSGTNTRTRWSEWPPLFPTAPCCSRSKPNSWAVWPPVSLASSASLPTACPSSFSDLSDYLVKIIYGFTLMRHLSLVIIT